MDCNGNAESKYRHRWKVLSPQCSCNEEEMLRKVGRQIESMIKDFEANLAVKDNQDALAMCALKLGANAEMGAVNIEKNIQSSNVRLEKINQLLDDLEEDL